MKSLPKTAIILLFQALFVFFLMLPSSWGETTPTAAVKQTIDQVLEVLNDETLKDESKSAARRAKLEEIIGQRFDYEEMAKRTLSKHWKTLGSGKQDE